MNICIVDDDNEKRSAIRDVIEGSSGKESNIVEAASMSAAVPRQRLWHRIEVVI